MEAIWAVVDIATKPRTGTGNIRNAFHAARLKSCIKTVFAERGRFQPSPLTRVDPYTNKCGVPMCPHFCALISRCRLLSQNREFTGPEKKLFF